MIGFTCYEVGQYITADKSIPIGRKTPIFNLCNKQDERIKLGEIKYNSKWRQYCFYQIDDTVFNKQCLNDIIKFIGWLNSQRQNKTDGY